MSRRRSLEWGGTALVVVLGPALVAWACGPYFPNRLLIRGDEAVLGAPVADFRRELEELWPDKVPFPALPPSPGQTAADQTAEVDLRELAEALEAHAGAPTPHARLIAAYERCRTRLRERANALQAEPTPSMNPEARPPDLSLADVPPGLPAEFELYLRGAVAYSRGDVPAARDFWTAVLALPAPERRYRATWAAFMLGKSWLSADPSRAVAAFQQTRSLAQTGSRDGLGLASASLGWEARAELNRGNEIRAIELYLQHMATGDPTAMMSLHMTAAAVAKRGHSALRAAAADPAARGVLTAYFLARGGPRYTNWPGAEQLEQSLRVWLDALESAEVSVASGAERLAWAAYQGGRFELAERWLARAPQDSPLADWLRAKLLLRAGRIHAATECLARAARAFPADDEWTALRTDEGVGWNRDAVRPQQRVLAELGVLRLARRQYVEALDALARGGYWLDAAYVAERVLTVDELRTYVDEHWPAVSADVEAAVFGAPPEWPIGSPDADSDAYAAAVTRAAAEERKREELRALGEKNVRLRYLLARRLARLEHWDAARVYLPRARLEAFDAYVAHLTRGRSTGRPDAERAEALWKAARLLRRHGLELIGTELDPDWAVVEGQYVLPAAAQVRAGLTCDERNAGRLPHEEEHGDADKGDAGPAKLNVASADELARAQRSAVAPPRRWHYRYRAADLAWQAARLMPDQSDATAAVLWEAGGWLKARDPRAADRFYRALVQRCGRTALGSAAARLRWFPSGGPRTPASDAP